MYIKLKERKNRQTLKHKIEKPLKQKIQYPSFSCSIHFRLSLNLCLGLPLSFFSLYLNLFSFLFFFAFFSLTREHQRKTLLLLKRCSKRTICRWTKTGCHTQHVSDLSRVVDLAPAVFLEKDPDPGSLRRSDP